MSSSVCQGLLHQDQENLKRNDNVEVGGWSFLQSLTKTSEIENEKVYVHPLHNQSSSSKLSTKGLEMCTESLGSETGSNFSESSDEVHFTSSLEQLDTCESSPKYYKNWVTEKRMKCRTSFPPPLTSIGRKNGIQLRPHREGGRLVLKAESVSSCITYFEAERSNGRLRLRLLQNCSPDCNQDHEAKYEEEEEEDEEQEPDVDEIETEEIETQKIVLDVEETEEVVCVGEEENGLKVRGQMGSKKLPMTSRCKEGEHERKEMVNWESFWVASS